MTTRQEAQDEIKRMSDDMLANAGTIFDWPHEMKMHFDPVSAEHWFGVIGAATKYGISEETAQRRAASFCEYTRSPLHVAVESLFGAPEEERGQAMMVVARYLEQNGPDKERGGAVVGELGRLLRAAEAVPVASPLAVFNKPLAAPGV